MYWEALILVAISSVVYLFCGEPLVKTKVLLSPRTAPVTSDR